MDDAVVCFAVIAGWLAFNGIVAIALTYCAPGERLWRRRDQNRPAAVIATDSEREAAILRVVSTSEIVVTKDLCSYDLGAWRSTV
jgi:hypothetical protein